MEYLRLLQADEREEARRDLIKFACYADPLAARWYGAAHLRVIADALMRVERGELTRVIIAVPPRHWKSSLASEKFSAWYLGRNPKSSIIVASYALNLAEKFSKSAREIIGGDKFRAVFPGVRIKRDSNSADDWLLEGGYRTTFRAVGTGGGISGHGARLILLDDVSDSNTMQSRTQTDNDWTWYKSVIRPRLEPDGAIVIINNRVGVNDLTGYLLDRERNDSADPLDDWTYIEIPALNADGAYLWEDRFGHEYYQKVEQDVTLWRVQYLQRPTVASGTEIKREWFEYVPNLPGDVSEQCRVVDTAWTLKKTERQDPDYFATVGSAMHGGWLYLIEPYKTRMQMPDTVNWIQNEKKLKPRVRFGMAKAAGEQIAKQFLERLGIPSEDLEAERSDIRVRLTAFISFASRGLIKLVCAPSEYAKWQQDRTYIPAQWAQFITESVAFPAGRHDDLLACCAGLTQMHGLVILSAPTKPRNKPAVMHMRTIENLARMR